MLQLKILQTRINIPVDPSWPIIMKIISMRVPVKLPLPQKARPALQRTFHLYG